MTNTNAVAIVTIAFLRLLLLLVVYGEKEEEEEDDTTEHRLQIYHWVSIFVYRLCVEILSLLTECSDMVVVVRDLKTKDK